ncbi:High-affinity nitrate transporter 2.2 [Phytophthora nicotianae]|uniref:Vacuolar protein sorting-associated protein 29 n=1 Tax=Phytophthora nicotianae TaxID=4792 RepID=A0A0W8DED5_PHYNI|nr:High-affinity nitrate transporter 2.2 [Phytophthora nicotianae]
MQHVLCTGNMVTKEQFDELRNLAPNVHLVAGDCDQMNVDILVTGHTHRSHIRTEHGKWFINPGSITGAFSSVSRPKVVAFLYELKGDNVVVSKSEITKEM